MRTTVWRTCGGTGFGVAAISESQHRGRVDPPWLEVRAEREVLVVMHSVSGIGTEAVVAFEAVKLGTRAQVERSNDEGQVLTADWRCR